VAHNTLAVDGQRQAAATGKLLAWHAEPGWSAVTADAGPAYANASLTRTLMVTPEYVLVVDEARSTDGKAHQFDWNYHNAGAETILSKGMTEGFAGFPVGSGYEHLKVAQHGVVEGEIRTRFVTAAPLGKVVEKETTTFPDTMRAAQVGRVSAVDEGVAGVDFAMLQSGRSEVFTGTGPGPDLHVPVPLVMVRRTGLSARFVGVLAPFKGDGGAGITLREMAGGDVEVSGTGFVDTVSVGQGVRYRRMRR
jgi:hypothetical protein